MKLEDDIHIRTRYDAAEQTYSSRHLMFLEDVPASKCTNN
jgi:hypothetical protein